jgi:pyruvate formate lyase activating enzyme
MEIKGVYPETLTDWPGKIPIEIFLGGCNYRCPFCHNPSLVGSNGNDSVSQEHFFSYLRVQKRKAWKDGVVISGGEPTVHKELPELILQIRKIGFDVKLDTNGSNPGVLESLIHYKLLDYVAMDIKTDFGNYSKAAGVDVDTEKIKKSIEIICSSGVGYEFRTTCVPTLVTLKSVKEIGETVFELNGSKKAKRYVIQQFRNSAEGDDKFRLLNPDFMNLKPYSICELNELSELAKPYFENVIIKAYD